MRPNPHPSNPPQAPICPTDKNGAGASDTEACLLNCSFLWRVTLPLYFPALFTDAASERQAREKVPPNAVSSVPPLVLTGQDRLRSSQQAKGRRWPSSALGVQAPVRAVCLPSAGTHSPTHGLVSVSDRPRESAACPAPGPAARLLGQLLPEVTRTVPPPSKVCSCPLGLFWPFVTVPAALLFTPNLLG